MITIHASGMSDCKVKYPPHILKLMADTHCEDQKKQCGAYTEGWICTREENHCGVHIGHMCTTNDVLVAAVWDDKPETYKVQITVSVYPDDSVKSSKSAYKIIELTKEQLIKLDDYSDGLDFDHEVRELIGEAVVWVD